MESATKITPRKALATLCFVVFGIADSRSMPMECRIASIVESDSKSIDWVGLSGGAFIKAAHFDKFRRKPAGSPFERYSIPGALSQLREFFPRAASAGLFFPTRCG